MTLKIVGESCLMTMAISVTIMTVLMVVWVFKFTTKEIREWVGGKIRSHKWYRKKLNVYKTRFNNLFPSTLMPDLADKIIPGSAYVHMYNTKPDEKGDIVILIGVKVKEEDLMCLGR